MAAGLYLHVPFCSAVCPYCDFAVTRGSAEKRAEYVSALTAEIARWSVVDSSVDANDASRLLPFEFPTAFDANRSFDTIYFGGGTPSYLEEGDLARILDALRHHLPVSAECRIFFEANPEDVTADRLSQWQRLGVSHLSLGVQSFDDAELQFLGRRHSGAESLASIEASLESGLEWVSFDLIYGLPGQELGRWQQTLQRAAALAAPHLSCYQLTIHEGTPFERQRRLGKLQELADPQQGAFFLCTHEHLEKAGLAPYEVSNFARSRETRSQHNQKYWLHQPYLGLGPSAHSFDGQRRWWNVRSSTDYTRRIAAAESVIEESEIIGPEALLLEKVMLGLRTRDGISLEALSAEFGVDLMQLNARWLQREVEGGRASLDGSQLALTRHGLSVVDGLVAGLTLEGSS